MDTQRLKRGEYIFRVGYARYHGKNLSRVSGALFHSKYKLYFKEHNLCSFSCSKFERNTGENEESVRVIKANIQNCEFSVSREFC